MKKLSDNLEVNVNSSPLVSVVDYEDDITSSPDHGGEEFKDGTDLSQQMFRETVFKESDLALCALHTKRYCKKNS